MTREGGSKLVRDWCCFSNINTVVNASWKQSSTTTRTWTRGARTSPSWIDGLLLEELVQRELALWLVILTLNHLCKAVYIYRTNSEFKFKNWWSISLMYTVKAIAHYAWCTWVRRVIDTWLTIMSQAFMNPINQLSLLTNVCLMHAKDIRFRVRIKK